MSQSRINAEPRYPTEVYLLPRPETRNGNKECRSRERVVTREDRGTSWPCNDRGRQEQPEAEGWEKGP